MADAAKACNSMLLVMQLCSSARPSSLRHFFYLHSAPRKFSALPRVFVFGVAIGDVGHRPAPGGPENSMAACSARQTTKRASEDELSDEAIAMSKKWMAAVSRARSDGLRDLSETMAWFEVRSRH